MPNEEVMTEPVIEEQNPTPPVVEEGTPPPSVVPSIDEDFKREVMGQVGSLANSLEAERQRNTDLMAQLEESRTPKPEPIDGTEFLQSPEQHIERIVAAQLTKQMAPVHQFITGITATNALVTTKQSVAAKNPAFKEIIDSYGDVVDQLLKNANITEETVTQAVLYIPGLVATGQLAKRGATPTPTTRTASMPANIPPAAPPAPRTPQANGKLELTEQERRIQRLLGVSDDEILSARAAGNVEVIK